MQKNLQDNHFNVHVNPTQKVNCTKRGPTLRDKLQLYHFMLKLTII